MGKKRSPRELIYHLLLVTGTTSIPLGLFLYRFNGFGILSIGSGLIVYGIIITAWGNVNNIRYKKSLDKIKDRLTIKKNELDRIESEYSQLLIKKEDELKSITAQNQKMYEDAFTNIYDFFNMYLHNIVDNELSGIITSEERITIYTHDESKNAFRQIGRFSPNPKYTKRSTSRKLYPENQGSIGEAWENGKCEITLNDPTIDLEAWERELKQDHNFKKDEIIKNISMKSRLFIGYAIENNLKNKVGVILFEGLQLERLSNNKHRLKEVFKEKHSLLSIMLIKERALRKIFPIND